MEKCNHIRKRIRKLRRSRVITVDPFEILQGEKKFYENLYKSRRNYSDENKLYFRFEDLPIPLISQEARLFGEGPISLAEYSKIINSFLLNKAPGNDDRQPWSKHLGTVVKIKSENAVFKLNSESTS